MKKSLFSLLIVCVIVVLAIYFSYPMLSSDAEAKVDTPLDSRLSQGIAEVRETDTHEISKEVQEAPQTDMSESHDDFITESKLAAYPGFGHNIDADEDRYTEEELRRELLLSDCMQSRGFEYTPAPSILVDEEAMNDAEEFERLLREASNDPNEIYVNSLSLNMRKAYFVALTGMENPNNEEGEAHDLAKDAGGCMQLVFEKVPGVYAKKNALSEELDEMEQRIASDSRNYEVNSRWANCMTEQGYEYSKPSDVHRASDQTMARLIGAQADTKEIEKAQIVMAKKLLQSQGCANKVELRKIRQQVRIEYENQFVDKYRELLED